MTTAHTLAKMWEKTLLWYVNLDSYEKWAAWHEKFKSNAELGIGA